MRLKSFQVSNFRSIRNSGKVDVNDVTCLVGKNESGKTALLQALYRLNPINENNIKFDPTEDYPRVDVDDYEYDVEHGKREPAEVIKAWFELEKPDLIELYSEFPDTLISNTELTLTKGYDNKLNFSFDLSEKEFVQSLISKYISTEIAKKLNSIETIEELNTRCSELSQDDPKNQEAVKSLVKVVNQIKKEGSANEYIFDKYIRKLLPKFLYFDEYYQMLGQENLDKLNERKNNNALKDTDRPLLGLLEHARIDLTKAINAKSTQDLKNKLEGAGNRLTKNLLQFWSQNKHLQIRFDVREGKPEDPEGMQSGVNLWAEIHDAKHLATTPMGRRSRGFVWFFSFLSYFGQQKAAQDSPLILLLDEPGLSLHAKAQSDLLGYIEKELQPNHQVIYTTHSPFLIDPSHFERVRLVQDNSMEDGAAEDVGTEVTSEVLNVNNDTLFPLQGALGYEIHQTLFIGPNTLVVEGPSDLLYLKVMSDVLERRGKTPLSEQWTITPAGGAGKIPMFISLIGSQKNMNIATLMDIDSETDQIANQLIREKILKKKNLITCSEYVESNSADLEDLFDRDFYLKLVELEFGIKIKSNDINKKIPRVLKALNPIFGNKGFNHYRPARLLSEKISDFEGDICEITINRFEELFSDLNKILRGK